MNYTIVLKEYTLIQTEIEERINIKFNMKKCPKCEILKDVTKFSKNKNHRDGLSTWCKLCCKEYQKELYKKYPWKRVFTDIKTRCNNKNYKQHKDYGKRGIRCLITEEEIKFLWFRDKAYLMKKPSIDREDNDGNYTLENCKFIEMEVNRIKDRFKKVLQYSLTNHHIRVWKSITDASNKLKINKSNIGQCCLGKRYSAGRYIWRYVNE